MEIFADSADPFAIRHLAEAGLIDRETTNPSLIAKSGDDFLETVADLAAMVDGPVSAEAAATKYDAMMRETAVLARIAPN